MDAVNFTANGTRWRAVPIIAEDLMKGQVPALTATGVLFTSADGDMRFLSLAEDAVPIATEPLATAALTALDSALCLESTSPPRARSIAFQAEMQNIGVPRVMGRRMRAIHVVIAACAAMVTGGEDLHAQSRRAAVGESPSTTLRANADTSGESELRAIIAELSAATLHHDATVIQRYYSPDYVMTFASGERGDFTNSMHVLTDTTRNEWRRHDISNERFVFYGSTAIVTFSVHSEWIARASNKTFDVHEQATQTWIRRDGRWTLVATHVTRTKV